jgi:hypothetical protein
VFVRLFTRQRVICRQAENVTAVTDLLNCEFVDIGSPPPYGQLITTVGEKCENVD